MEITSLVRRNGECVRRDEAATATATRSPARAGGRSAVSLSQNLASYEGAGVEYDGVEDAELLAAAARGEQAAFAVFYRRWLPQVIGYHLRRTRDRELAFDLAAETFAAVVAGLGRFDPARGSVPAWLFEIAAHKLVDSVRRARVESSARRRLRLDPVFLEDADLERVQELASLANSERLASLLAGLPPDQRVAIQRHVLEERAYPEIAYELRCSEAVVRQRGHRGLTRMREQLKETE
jgi:RNA polymerase sigma factor (sigma-70 family)